MEYKGKKYCFVPFCGANRKLNPDRIFFLVPKEKFMRDLWIKAAKRNASITGPNTMFYCCQDHFDLESDMDNYKKYIENKDKVRPVLKPNVVPHRFDCLVDLPAGSDMRKRRMMTEHQQDEQDHIHLSYIASICNGEEVTQLTLDEMNKLLVDINNLGVLGDVLNAYNQVYNEMTWKLDFMVEHSTSWFDISVKKVVDRQSDVVDRQSDVVVIQTDECSSAPATPNKRRKLLSHTPSHPTTNHRSDVEVEVEGTEAASSALLDGGHVYTKTLSGPDGVLPKHRVHTVYQCEYCCYGSLEKYCLKHHIRSIHSTRYTASARNKNGKEEKSQEKDAESSDEVARKPCDRKTKPLPYYMPRDKSVTELTRLSKQVKEKKKWLEDFIQSMTPNKVSDTKNKPTDRIYACTLCDFTGGDQTAVYKHIGLSHTNHTDVFSECPVCGDYTDGRKALLVHLRHSHPGANTFRCSQCPYNTRSAQLFFRHVLEVHKRVKHFKCDDCSFNSARKANLVKHIDAYHKRESLPEEHYQASSDKSETCDTTTLHEDLHALLCSQAGKQVALNRHVTITHRPPRPPASTSTSQGKVNCIFVCTQCGDKFSRKQTLDQHTSHCHVRSNNFSCASCDFTSVTKPTMDIHVREIHKGYLPFKCDKCDFKTSLKNKFQNHYKAVHLKQKPYECPHCSVSFSLKQCAAQHIQDVHMKKKPHPCGYCEFSAARKVDLKSHLQSVHSVSHQNLPQVLRDFLNVRRLEGREKMQESLLICSAENLEDLQHEYEHDDVIQDDTLEHVHLQGEIILDEELHGEILLEEQLHDATLQHQGLQDDALQDNELQDEILVDEELHDGTLQHQCLQDDALQDEELQDNDLQDDTLQDEELQDEILVEEELQDDALQDEELQDNDLQDEELQDEILVEEELQDDALQDEELQDNDLQDDTLQDEILVEEELGGETLQEDDDGLDGDNTEILHNIDLVIEG